MCLAYTGQSRWVCTAHRFHGGPPNVVRILSVSSSPLDVTTMITRCVGCVKVVLRGEFRGGEGHGGVSGML